MFLCTVGYFYYGPPKYETNASRRCPSTHLLHDVLGEVFCLAGALVLERGVLRLAGEKEKGRESGHLHLCTEQNDSGNEDGRGRRKTER